MLERQIDVLADPLALRHRRERVLVYRRWIEIEETNPFEAVDLVQLAEQPRERAALSAIDPVEGLVLRDEEQLLHPARCERTRFAHDRFSRTAPVLSTQPWNDAEGAFVVAAFRDLHVGIMLRRRQQSRRLGIVDVR